MKLKQVRLDFERMSAGERRAKLVRVADWLADLERAYDHPKTEGGHAMAGEAISICECVLRELNAANVAGPGSGYRAPYKD